MQREILDELLHKIHCKSNCNGHVYVKFTLGNSPVRYISSGPMSLLYMCMLHWGIVH